MRRVTSLALMVGMLAIVVLGCGRQPAKKNTDATERPPVVVPPVPQVAVQPKDPLAPAPKQTPGPQLPTPAPEKPASVALPVEVTADAQAKYEAALTEALTLVADQKWAEALAAFEAARSFQATEFVKGEIDRIKNRLEQEAAAKKTVQNIATILDEGKADDAAKLAQQALKEFGDRDLSEQLVKLRLQAEALGATEKKEDAAARFERFRAEAQAALTEKNLRAAALALEQALAAKEDAVLRAQYEETRVRLEKYDGLRKKAAELRQDPVQLEDALAALHEAAKTWDTLQIRQDIDEYTLLLQRRRDTVSVADFDVRGDLGLAASGRAFAEELLPHLKPRFDLVERQQVARILEELKLEAGWLDDPQQQREVGKLVKVRYLVLGSVTRLGGVTVHARLVDLKSGLIVQTAKVVAATPEQALGLVPELGKQLLMNDEEKLAYEQQLAQKAKRVDVFAADAPLPPPPVVGKTPPPHVVEVYSPPQVGGLALEAFQALPPPPPPGKVLPPPPPAPREVVVKQRLVQAFVHLGDDLFQRGQYKEAHRHFEFALSLSPGHFDLQLRIERTKPHVPPPPPPVIVVQQPVVVVPPRPRIAVLNFATFGDPRVVPPSLGPWTAHQLAPYFSPYFEVANENEVYWYMGRLGMSVRDLMDDPHARRWLGRALGVRYFVLGTVQQTASFDVNTYLIDAEYGFLQGHGFVHVHSLRELKLRLAELAHLTRLSPAERAALLADAQRFDLLLVKGHDCMKRNDFAVAITIWEDALKLRPGNVQVLLYLNQARTRAQQLALEEERRRQFLLQKALEEQARRRQWELAQATEAARLKAAALAAAQAAEEKRLLEERRRLAYSQLITQAQVALKIGNFSLAITKFQSAGGLMPHDDLVLRDLALARAQAEKAAQLKAAQEAAARAAALQKEKEAALLQAKLQLEAEKQKALAELEAQKKIQQERDKAAYQRAIDEAQNLMRLGKYDEAIRMLQLGRAPAEALGKTAVIEALLQHAAVEDAKARAQAKGEQERLALEKKLALERERRKKAEEEAKQNQKLYQQALALADQALAQKDFDLAEAKYEEAARIFQTDAALAGKRKAAGARAQAKAEAAAAAKKALEQQQKAERVKTLLAEGQKALEAGKHEAALAAFTQARALAPDNLDVLTALTKAEQARDRALAEARKKSEDAKAKEQLQQTTAAYQKWIQQGRLALDAQRYDDAIAAFGQAQKVVPGDKAAGDFLKDAQLKKQAAQDASAAQAKKKEEADAAQKRLEQYNALLASAQKAWQARQYDEALKVLAQAEKLSPGNKLTQALLMQVQRAQAEEKNAADLAKKQAAQKAAEELAKRKQFDAYLAVGRGALQAKKFDDAKKYFAAALTLFPNDKEARLGLEQATRLLEDSKTKSTPKVEPKTQPKAEPKVEPKTQPKVEPKVEPKAQPKIEPKAEPKAEPKPDPKTQPKIEPKLPKTEPKAKPTLPPPPNKKEVEVGSLLGQAARLEAQQKHGEALSMYQAALKLAPDSAPAKEGLRRTQFALHVQEGQRLLDMMKYAEAAARFEAALQLAPGNPAVLKLLQQARDKQQKEPKKDKNQKK